jgi:hypothetical protein
VTREGDTVRSTTLGHTGGGAGPRHRGPATGMNTTKLISHWSMSGARRDVAGRFRATDDIGAVIAGNQSTPAPFVVETPFLVKGLDEDSWQPLGEGTSGRI